MAVILVVTTVDLASWGQPASSAVQDAAPVMLNDSLPLGVKGLEVEQKLGATIPKDLPLVDSRGRKLRSGQVFDGGLPVILTLNYSNCPMLCNVQLNQLSQSLEKLDLRAGRDFRLLSVSIDPKETDQRLREMKQRYIEQIPAQQGADEAWVFARTNKKVVDQLCDVTGFAYRYDRASGEYAHPAMLAFCSGDGVVTRYSLGVAFPPDDMKLALLEAGEGKVGGIVDQFVLWCYAFDPAANSYTPQAWKIMRLAGAVTVLAMFLALIPYWTGRKSAPHDQLDRSEQHTIPAKAIS
ncbi:MAG: SCO family protein [Planctomycetota bacterium]